MKMADMPTIVLTRIKKGWNARILYRDGSVAALNGSDRRTVERWALRETSPHPYILEIRK